MSKKLLIIIGIILIVALAFALAPKRDSENNGKPTIKIGVSLPITGPAAYVGSPGVKMAKMAVDKWKDKDTKYNYKLIIEDDQLDIKTTATVGKKLLHADNINALVSIWGFAAEVYKKLSIDTNTIHMTCSWGDGLSDGKNNFNNVTSTANMASTMLKYLKSANVRSIGLVGQNSGSDHQVIDNFAREFQKAGIKVEYKEFFTIGDKDFKGFWAKKRNPDIILVLMTAADMTAFIKQKNEAGNTTLLTTQDYFKALDPQIVNDLPFVVGAMGTPEFTAMWEKVSDAKLGDCLGSIYDNIDLLIFAFENAEEPSTEAVAKVLRSVKNYKGGQGIMTVSEDGHIDSDAILMRWHNGELETIKE